MKYKAMNGSIFVIVYPACDMLFPFTSTVFLVVSSQTAKYHNTRKCMQVVDLKFIMLFSDFKETRIWWTI
jgi:hypothetical protein